MRNNEILKIFTFNLTYSNYCLEDVGEIGRLFCVGIVDDDDDDDCDDGVVWI